MERQYVIRPKYKWIHIIEQQVSKYKYGYKGEVSWYTDRSENIQIISSIHLEDCPRFKRLFAIKKKGVETEFKLSNEKKPRPPLPKEK